MRKNNTYLRLKSLSKISAISAATVYVAGHVIANSSMFFTTAITAIGASVLTDCFVIAAAAIALISLCIMGIMRLSGSDLAQKEHRNKHRNKGLRFHDHPNTRVTDTSNDLDKENYSFSSYFSS